MRVLWFVGTVTVIAGLCELCWLHASWETFCDYVAVCCFICVVFVFELILVFIPWFHCGGCRCLLRPWVQVPVLW